MNLFDILFMQKTGKIKPDADLFDILFAKVTGVVERLVTIVGNPLSFLAKKAQTAQSTKVSMEPVQDLHGYNNPWPAGGGKNKFSGELYQADSTINTSDGTIISNSDYDVYILPTLAVGDYALSVLDSSDVSAVAKRAASYDTNDNLVGEVYAGNHTPSTTVRKGKIFTVPSGISYTLCSVRKTSYDIMVESGSTITDYAPYSNICPIFGRSSVEIKGCGKNLVNNDDIDIVENRYGVEFSVAGSYTIKAFIEPSVNQYIYARIKHSDGTVEDYKTIVQARRIYSRNFVVAEGDVLQLYNAASGSSVENTAAIFNARQIMAVFGDTEPTTYESYQQSNNISVRMVWNLFNKDNSSSIINANIPSGSSGTIPANANSRLVFIKCKPNTTYTVSKMAGARFRVCTTIDVPADGVACSQIISDNTASSITITTNATAEYLCSYVYNTTVDSGTDTEMIASVQIEEGSSASPYRQYIGDAVYGGTLNVETGVLTIDSVELEQNPNNWKKASNYDIFYYALGTTDPPYYPLEVKLICNRYKTGNSVTSASGAYTRGDKTICPRGTSDSQRDRFYVRDDDYATLEDFVADISSLQIVYVLPEPSTIQLTPSEVQLLKGVNNIWIEDEGAVMELTYRA